MRAGENSRDRLGDQPFGKRQIVEEVLRLSGYAPNNIFPSDYSYNMINKYPGSFESLLFEQLRRGTYKYLGPEYKYSGTIYCRKVGEERRSIYSPGRSTKTGWENSIMTGHNPSLCRFRSDDPRETDERNSSPFARRQACMAHLFTKLRSL